ncbi:MAG: DUF1858 domain-containing protein [Clostridia bacterium]|nr:DUF1858 domain-containing protein [Clostridia bacterium]
MEISKDMTMGEVLQINEALAEILLDHGMHCVGCPAHSFETLDEACMVHGIDVDSLVVDLNKFLNE